MSKRNLEIKPCDFDQLTDCTGNVYESVLAFSKRSIQLSEKQRMAFRAELEELNIREDEEQSLLDSDIRELVSKRYEMERKPLLNALDELLEGKLKVSYRNY